MVVPSVGLVVDDRCTETPGRVDAGSRYGDGGQVHQEHREPDGQRGQNLIGFKLTHLIRICDM